MVTIQQKELVMYIVEKVQVRSQGSGQVAHLGSQEQSQGSGPTMHSDSQQQSQGSWLMAGNIGRARKKVRRQYSTLAVSQELHLI